MPGVVRVLPFNVTRPSANNRSASLRDATPARAINFEIRSPEFELKNRQHALLKDVISFLFQDSRQLYHE